MTKYLLNRLLRGLLSIIAVVAIVMLLVYSLMNRDLVLHGDNNYQRLGNNDKIVYRYRVWSEYGYLDYVPYADYINSLAENGEIDEDTRAEAAVLGRNADGDSATTKTYVAKFTEYYESRGYTIMRLNAIMNGNTVISGGRQQLFAYRDQPFFLRLWNYITGIFEVDNIHYAQGDVGERGLTFTFFDPAYGGDVFSPAIIGNGTKHKYLLYFDDQFPFIHQNVITIRLGTSYSVNQGVDVFDTMNNTQGNQRMSTVIYPTGVVSERADNIHTATYVQGSLARSEILQTRYTDDYTSVSLNKTSMSKVGFSFVIGIISVVIAYLLGVPLGILMARKKDKIADKIGTIYIIFIIAVPSLAYIFLFKAIGGAMGLKTSFDMTNESVSMYILPIVSLALPSVASLMKWLRRYMIDQMNSDYVKFARSGGLSENEIFTKHIFKNAVIPIVHGIPGSILGALTGAIITERVYVVPGAGNLLTEAINLYDNGVIVGVTMFYATLSVVSIILGDILMAMVDPRISFSSKGR